MHILQLDHIQLSMPADRERAHRPFGGRCAVEKAEARAFYEGLLGIPEVPKPPHLALRGGCWFERGALKIHLGVEKDFSPARKAHPAFLVDDLASFITLLERNGYQPRKDQPLEGYDRVYVNDPFGNRLELMQRTE